MFSQRITLFLPDEQAVAYSNVYEVTMATVLRCDDRFNGPIISVGAYTESDAGLCCITCICVQ